MKSALMLLMSLATFSVLAEKEYLWPEGRMPDAQPKQIAAMTDVSYEKDFNASEWRKPYIDWLTPPEHPNGTCVILISGGSYRNLCDVKLINEWNEKLTALGCQCVNLVYRTPWPDNLPIYQTAWEDAQRAVRIVRSQAMKRGYFPERIGTMSMSAGSHLATLLATSSLTPAYERVDELDDISCEIAFAVAFAPAFVLTDGYGTPNTRGGEGPDVKVADCFKFDANTAPMCLLHGGNDKYSPLGSTKIYRELRKCGIPAEVHIIPYKGHGAHGFDRAVEFLRQMEFLSSLEKEIALEDRFASDDATVTHVKEPIWPKGKIPDKQYKQEAPYMEWYIPSNRTTKAIQVVWSGGGYHHSKPDGFEVAPIRRYLNGKGMAVVTVNYRHPRPDAPFPKHLSAWQDVQRAIRIVRRDAVKYGLDPDDIGIMGPSAGGHLALLAATTSLTRSYAPRDEIDTYGCNVQWAVSLYPAYCLTDGLERQNSSGGNEDDSRLAPEFAFDMATPSILFMHGDADKWAAMNSVKAWEQLHRMGIQSELHTLAKRSHCFQRTASPGTGSYDWMDRVWDFICHKRNIQRNTLVTKSSPPQRRRTKRMSNPMIVLMTVASLLLGGCIVYNTPPGDRRVTLAPDLGDTVVVTDIRMARDSSRHYVFQANLVNNTDVIQKIEYRVGWLGENGLEIQSIASNWRFRSLAPREIVPLKAVAPVDYACDFRFHVQEARPALQ